MNKRKNGFVALFSAGVLLLSVVGLIVVKNLIFDPRLYHNKVTVRENEINNDYNNYLSGGDLCRIDNKLYYNYRKNAHDYGLMEISENGSNLLVWYGPHPDLKGIGFHIEKILKHNNSIYRVNQKSSELEKFDFSERKFKGMGAYTDHSTSNQFSLDESGKMYYLKRNKTPYVKDDLVCNDNNTEYVIAKQLSYFYFLNNKIYYFRLDGSKGYLCEYDCNKRIEKILFSYDTSNPNTYDDSYFLICNDKIVITSRLKIGDKDNALYKYSLCVANLNGDVTPRGVYEIEDYSNFSFNLYNNQIFVCTNKGMEIIDMNSEKIKKITEKPTKSCYILDYKWIYFIDHESCLWRTTHDGLTTEKVFG